jgi:hypothetical protein
MNAAVPLRRSLIVTNRNDDAPVGVWEDAPMAELKSLAQIGYEAAREMDRWRGEEGPPWEVLPSWRKRAWQEASFAIVKAYEDRRPMDKELDHDTP